MGYKRQDVEATKQFAKKFVRYKEGVDVKNNGFFSRKFGIFYS